MSADTRGIRELARILAIDLTGDRQRGKHRISHYAKKIWEFAESELAAEREQCCKDMCAWCREPSVTYDTKAVQVHGTWKHRYNNGELVLCRAAAIRSR